jgi:hypothetical protein
VFFFDGVAKEKLIGFNGLTEGLAEGHEDEWPTIRLARLLGNAKIINEDMIRDEDAELANAQARLAELRLKSIQSSDFANFDEDDDFDDLNI